LFSARMQLGFLCFPPSRCQASSTASGDQPWARAGTQLGMPPECNWDGMADRTRYG
jgi:hypothetical protein